MSCIANKLCIRRGVQGMQSLVNAACDKSGAGFLILVIGIKDE